MTWTEYLNEHEEGIEETERESNRAWLWLLLWLALGESHVVRRTRPLRARLPVDGAGRWDTTRPQPFRRYRAAVAREAATIERTLIVRVTGRLDLTVRSTSTTGTPAGGIVYPPIRRVVTIAEAAADRALAIARSDGGPIATPVAPAGNPPRRQRSLSEIARERGRQANRRQSGGGGLDGPPGRRVVLPPPITPDDPPAGNLRRDDGSDDISQERTRSARRRGAITDIGQDGEENPRRNIRFHSRRMLEDTIRLTGPYGSPEALDRYWARAERPIVQGALDDYRNTPPRPRTIDDEVDEWIREWRRDSRDSGLEGDL